MKARKILSLILSVVMVLSLLPLTALNTVALDVTDKVSEVELTLPEAQAGNTVNLDISSVEVKHHMTYKVVGIRWYKYPDNRQMGVESGADTYFIGGETYIVEIDLEVKSGNSGWNFTYEGVDTDYSGIHATVNGKDAIVKYPPLNSDKHKTVTVSYEFSNIPYGVVNYPGVTIPSPVAGTLPPSVEEMKVSNSRTMWVPESEYFWYVYENNAWRRQGWDEHFVAGARYKVEFAMQTFPGFCYNLENASDYRNDGGMHIWGYVNGDKRTMALKKLGTGQDGVAQYDDAVVYVTYEFTSCEAQLVDSVSFSGITPPSATQHPRYNAPTMTGNYALYTDEAFTGGAEFNFVNGIQWTSTNGLLNEESVFEQGAAYYMTFFIKTFDTHRFADWVEASADVGYVDVMVLPDDPTIALVTVSFAPCDGGVLSEVNISGIKNPVHGEAPDYEFTYGQGYDVGTSDDKIVWYDLTANKKVLPGGTFEYGHKYELRIILRSEKQILGASTGKFEFAPHDALTVKANGITATKLERYNGNPEANWVLASIPFECQKHTIEQVVIDVNAPVEGQIPASKLEKGDDTYNIEGFMFVDSDTDTALKADEVFAGGKSYRFVLAVSPAEGFTFENGITTAMVNGQYAGVIYADETGALISYSFLSEELPYFTVAFTSGEGAGSMSGLTVKGGVITLPDSDFTAPEGKTFAGWSTDGGMTLLAGEYNVTENVSFEAVYVNNGEHRHVYSEEYSSSDDIFHYKSCIDIENCTDPTGSTISDMHDWGNNTNCDESCTVCGYIRTTNQAGEPLHLYAHECSEVCPNCGLEREAAPHTPGEEANCTDAQKCTVCNKVLEEAKGHTPGDAATCEKGQTCTACGVELAPKTDVHTPGDAATCDKAQTCTVCGTELAPKTDDHTPGDAATCDKAQTCTVCGTELVPKTEDHTPGDAATCTKAQTCTICGAEIAPANGHSAGVEWITDENGHHKLCACGEKVEAGTHVDADGDKECDVCGYKASGGFTEDGQAKDGGMSVGVIVAIVIGAVLVVGIGVFAIVWFVIKKKSFADLLMVFKKK